MNALWDAYWPVVVAAVIIGLNSGVLGFRSTSKVPRSVAKRRRALALGGGIAASLLFGAAWHGPVGWGDRFAAGIEQDARTTLDHLEMTKVSARLERGPLERTIVLDGPADDFQRSELVRIMSQLPGAGDARWTDMSSPARLPLLAEVELAALFSFGVGLVLAYLLELRRRSRAQWRW